VRGKGLSKRSVSAFVLTLAATRVGGWEKWPEEYLPAVIDNGPGITTGRKLPECTTSASGRVNTRTIPVAGVQQRVNTTSPELFTRRFSSESRCCPEVAPDGIGRPGATVTVYVSLNGYNPIPITGAMIQIYGSGSSRFRKPRGSCVRIRTYGLLVNTP
jgi:hypothetical protein